MPSRSPVRRSAPTNSKKLEPRHLDLHHASGCHRIALKRVGTARRFTLRVRAATGEIVLTLPPHASVAAASTFAHRNLAWIVERVATLAPKMPLSLDSRIPLRGVIHRVERRVSLRRAVWVSDDAEGEPTLQVGGPEVHAEDTLQRFLLGEARRDLTEAVARHAADVGKSVRRISLRDTTSRWGSCSSTGALSFSWRLILAPPFVLDYLAAHEVAHLVHMNHSAAFWATANRLAPRLSEAEAWLKAHGSSLHGYGR